MDRFALTEAYRALGVLGCSDALAKAGIRYPAEQMVAITNFVVVGLGESDVEGFPPQWNTEYVLKWSQGRLLDVAIHGKQGVTDLEQWHSLMLRSMTIIAWNPLREFGNLLSVRCGSEAFRRARARLRKRGFDPVMDLLLDLRDEFANERLPKALRAFDPARGTGHEAEWLASTFYRFALQALIADQTNKKQLFFLSAVATEPDNPETLLIRKEEERVKEALPAVLETLIPAEKTAIVMYFGGHGHEATLAEIGARIGMSEYRTRETVTSALAKLAVRLGVQGALDDEEYSFAQALFTEGMDPATAARSRNIPATNMRHRIINKFRNALRTRTSKPAADLMRNQDMSYEMASFLFRDVPHSDREAEQDAAHRYASERTDLLERLSRQKTMPKIRQNSDDGVLYVDLDGREFEMEHIIRSLDGKTIEELEHASVPLEWLLVGASPTRRADVPDDIYADHEALAQTRQRSWDAATFLYHRCIENFGSPLPESKDHTIERVLVSLIAISQAIESTLDAFPHDSGEARYVIRWRSGRNGGSEVPWGFWESMPDAPLLNLGELFLEKAQSAGGLPPEFAKRLVTELGESFRRETLLLPGFDQSGWETPTSIVLTYRLPTVDSLG
ncbi:hypothetical protein C1S70_31030 (plasmid) [Azospirillum argentinense]|uniref:RNA polymerase sigma-70 region 4 domain-containing protein n=1 Tax=Azospirillum argentinense TaxID=2970906 RepID=A0A2K1FR80_9PROT|nr:sigma-70 family RNA polymerase sigma factor [Azospirillum argentinense]PNQ95041.1 hypothetical protein C1S70_31030 [Azospirillum argentinense]